MLDYHLYVRPLACVFRCFWVFLFIAVAEALVGLVGCADDTKVGAKIDASVGARDGEASGSDGPILTLPGGKSDAGCGMQGCTSGATKFCGDIVDACGQTVHCGSCPAGQECKAGACARTIP